ncbi:TD and POZ domain-containing protein 1-like [Microplitis mediator]|uniref:TD and POZ domain-containing protein 1-like n=1 Tax=Microplitis mediator TaxID=375433 RepID=UPI002552AFE1|nr:TD and POZ domain-containing protein 1-like [Microplitis mediator]
MPLKKIERNVHTERRIWKLENISETFAKVDLYRKKLLVDPVYETCFFSTKFQDHDIDWYVKLKFRRNELKGGINIFFDAVKKFQPNNHVTCNFYLVDADKNKFFMGRKNRKYDSMYHYYPETDRSTFCTLGQLPNTKDKLLPNNTMTLLIELIIYLDENPIFPIEEIEYEIEPVVNLDNISNLYPLKDGGDVKIYVQDVEFSVHETVLKTRCPESYQIFARHQQMSGNNDNQLVLTDIKPEIFERVLEFIYTGKVKDLDDYAESLLEAASQYGLTGLKYMCEFSLADNYLTYKNSKKIIKMAFRCGAVELRLNANKLRNNSSMTLMDYSVTRSGTLIETRPSGKKEMCKNRFKKDIPKGIRIVPY